MSNRAPLLIRFALCAALLMHSSAASAGPVIARTAAAPGVHAAPAGVGLAQPASFPLAAPSLSPLTPSLVPLSMVPTGVSPTLRPAAAPTARAEAAPGAVARPAAAVRYGTAVPAAAAALPAARAQESVPEAVLPVGAASSLAAAASGAVGRAVAALPAARLGHEAPALLAAIFDNAPSGGAAVLPANAALPSQSGRRLARATDAGESGAAPIPSPAPRGGLLTPSMALGAGALIMAGNAMSLGFAAAMASAGFPAALLIAHSLTGKALPEGDSAPRRWLLSASAAVGFMAYVYSVSLLSPVAAALSVTAAVMGAAALTAKGRAARPAAVDAGFSKDGFLRLSRDPKGKLLLTLREEDFGKPMMLNAMLEKGIGENFLYSMAPLTEALVYFRRSGDRVQLMRKNMGFRAAGGSSDAQVVDRSFSDSMIASVSIAAADPKSRSVTLGFEEMLLSDLFDLKGILAANYPGAGGYSLSRELSGVVSAKTFPKNAEASAELILNNPEPGERLPVPDARNLTLQVRYSFSALPEPGFLPRKADDRVGFFTTAYRDFTDLGSAPAAGTAYTNLVQRWRLEKQDPSAALSPVKKPIVWWLENTVPPQHRAAVREGILKWNAAFERLGFKDAIVVRQQPDPGTQPADEAEAQFDAADVRYNVVHWFTGSDADIAFAQWRTDPRTGEIYNGHVNFSLQVLDGRGYRGMKEVLEADHGHKHGPSCRYGAEVSRNIAALEDSPMPEELRRAFAHELVVSYIVHEFGHALGLRHNFAATQMRSLEEIARARDGIVSQSVMDYAAISIPAEENPGGVYVQTELGPYDYLAIEYGYRPFDGKSHEEARAELNRAAGRIGEPGLEFATDEQVDGTDPYAAHFDFGPEPLEYAEMAVARGRRLISAMAAGELEEGADFGSLRRRFVHLFRSQVLGSFRLVLPYVGGIRMNRVRAGQNAGKLPYEAVPAEKQRAAVRFLADNLFSDESMALPKGLLARLAPDLRDTPAGEPDPALLPYEEGVTDARKWAIESLLSVERLKRMAESRQLVEGRSYSVRELVTDLGAAIWTEAEAKRVQGAFAISPLRRRAQAAFVEHLLRVVRGTTALEDDENGGLREAVNPYSSEAVAAARGELARIAARVRLQLDKERAAKRYKADPAVVEHLENTYGRIQSLLRD